MFGEFCVAVILSEVGRDVSKGARNIKASGGESFVEDSKAAAVTSMRQTALESKVAGAILLLSMLGEVVMDQGHHLN